MMNQETAKKLLIEGGTFVFLSVPKESEFGIDMECWITDEGFRGIKMIPPGLHYIHYSAVSKKTGELAPRSGFMHCFERKEMFVANWDEDLEDLAQYRGSVESIQQLKENFLKLDRHLAPYPFEIHQRWTRLTTQLTGPLARKLSPENVIIRSSLELLSTTDADRPRGAKSGHNNTSQDASNDEDTSQEQSDCNAVPGTSDPQKAKRLTRKEKEEAMLPNLKPVPGTAMRFTEIPQDKYPPGSTPEEITKHCLDQTYTLELMIAQHDEPLHLIGELQFTYLCFLIGQSLDAFEHWKNLVTLICSCEEAIHKYRSLYFHFIKAIEVQIEEMPAEFMADIVTNKNVVYKKLRDFFKTAYISKVDGRLLSLIETFKENLTITLQWDFSGLDVEDDDERPVVVNIDNEQEDD